jgi:hypothetical protein
MFSFTIISHFLSEDVITSDNGDTPGIEYLLEKSSSIEVRKFDHLQVRLVKVSSDEIVRVVIDYDECHVDEFVNEDPKLTKGEKLLRESMNGTEDELRDYIMYNISVLRRVLRL